MLRLFVVLAFACLAVAGRDVQAAEICHDQSGQYAETRTCVSSALAPQGGNTYGPDRITGRGDGAWCEGVAGAGVGQFITLSHKPEQVIRTIVFVNGYAKTPQAFRANGRVKRARIETSGGTILTVTLKDSSTTEEIRLPVSKVSWVRLTILEVYPGSRHSDTCISSFYFNYEEFGAPEEELK
jgi:hypothetical protein